MITTAIYPLTERNAFMLDALRAIRTDLAITCAVIPNAYKDLVIEDEIQVVHKIEDISGDIKCVVFLSSWDKQRMFEEMRYVLQSGISVLCANDISKENQHLLSAIANEANAVFESYDSEALFSFLQERNDVFTPQESVIISIGALSKGLNTSQTILALYSELVRKGYHVGVVVSDPELRVLNFQWLPIQKIIGRNLDESIMQINRFMNYFQLTQRVDVILVQLPDEGLFRVANEYETCFGAETYLLSQAIAIDYGIMLLPAMYFDLETFDSLNTMLMYRYGFEMNSVCITHNLIDLTIPQGTTRMGYYLALDKDVNALATELRKGQYQVFVDTDKDWCESVVNDIIESLS